MMQPLLARRPDIHGRPQPHSGKAFEDGDVFGGVVALGRNRLWNRGRIGRYRIDIFRHELPRSGRQNEDAKTRLKRMPRMARENLQKPAKILDICEVSRLPSITRRNRPFPLWKSLKIAPKRG